uniref:Uncharacterized protein n=1 Tax=Ditylenchus dipsaci TaxID=166011 RepID=A0A915DK58_9BILA
MVFFTLKLALVILITGGCANCMPNKRGANKQEASSSSSADTVEVDFLYRLAKEEIKLNTDSRIKIATNCSTTKLREIADGLLTEKGFQNVVNYYNLYLQRSSKLSRLSSLKNKFAGRKEEEKKLMLLK